MKHKREVVESLQLWRAAAHELDVSIGIQLRDGEAAPTDTMDIRRFRQALLAEREARLRYAAALRADHKPVPAELIWDLSDASGT